MVGDRLRCGFAQFKLGAHFLDKRSLLFQFTLERIDFLLLLLYYAVFFQELVEQNRVHRVIAHGV